MPASSEAVPAHKRRGDQGELYRRHHERLRSGVAGAVKAPREVIEDACQNAWASLLESQPELGPVFDWLYVAACREALRLYAFERRDAHLDSISWAALAADAPAIEHILQAREALEVLARLPARQRADLTLLVAGYSYREIGKLDGGRAVTAVKTQLREARARARAAWLGDPAGTRST